MLIGFDQYLRNYCIVPISCCCFCLLVLGLEIRHVMRYIRLSDVSIKNILGTIFCVAISIVLLVKVGVVPLCHGGIFLVFENESDAVKMTGPISSIESVDYNLYAQSEGYFIVINDAECMGIYINSKEVPLSVGEYVDVLYLPKSGYILSIEDVR